jgi:hypothetical protein
MTDQLPKPRDASAPFSWDSLTDEENEQAHQNFLTMEHAEDIEAAACDSNKATELLLIAAGYLERREQMPYPLADHIAKAFNNTASAKESDALSIFEARRNTLAAALKITAPGPRPKSTANKVGTEIFRLMMNRAQNKRPLSETAAAREIATMLKIKHRTAKDHWVIWKETNPDSYKLLIRYGDLYKVGG